ncbi:MAG: hypothetical protein LBH43_19135 [Treponema sp.]|jgi:hypothetical protein|nr:hypothetical protein [Treponema sp.]
MKKINSDSFHSPVSIFIVYVLASCLAIMAFRFIFPGEAPPLPYFSRSWRLLRGLLDFCVLFPALALSALVLPFGMIPGPGEVYGSLSPKFFQRLGGPIIIAISSTLIYGLVFFLALPLLKDHEENLRFKGELYHMAKEKAEAHRKAGEWIEEYLFINICESVWPDSPELAEGKLEAVIHSDKRRFELIDKRETAREKLIAAQRKTGLVELADKRDLSVTDAISRGEEAFAAERYYDAHWFATVALRIAVPGAIEEARAKRLASRAWDRISSLELNSREKERLALFTQKQAGYQAMVSGDWVRAFYIFHDLAGKTPDDPDTEKFYVASEKGVKESAFFVDEMELLLAENLVNAVFSLPARLISGEQGRAVLRFASLSTASDYAYGTGLEYLVFDSQSQPYIKLNVPYTKLLPTTLDGQAKTLVMTKAFDRNDQSRRFEPAFEGAVRPEAQIVLDIGFDEFLVLSRIRRGLPNMSMAELFSASKKFGSAGYIVESFQAEIINRLGAALFFLPMSIIALIIAWRCRAKNRPRYMFIPMLFILPFVFNSITRLYETVFANLGIWLILGLGFPLALTIFIIAQALIFIISLIMLATQKG